MRVGCKKATTAQIKQLPNYFSAQIDFNHFDPAGHLQDRNRKLLSTLKNRISLYDAFDGPP